MTDIYPFADPDTEYTRVRNAVFDEIIPHLSHAESVILFVIIRKTLGWKKDEDAISYSQLAKGANVKSMATIKKYTQSLADKGLIFIKKTSKSHSPFVYSLNKAYVISLGNDRANAKSNNLPDKGAGSLNGRELPHQSLETQKIKKKETIKDSTTPVYRIYLRLAEIQRGINKGQTLGGAKRLLNDGFLEDDIIGCGKWVQVDPWRVERGVALTINEVEKKIDNWIIRGRPSTHKANGQPVPIHKKEWPTKDRI